MRDLFLLAIVIVIIFALAGCSDNRPFTMEESFSYGEVVSKDLQPLYNNH